MDFQIDHLTIKTDQKWKINLLIKTIKESQETLKNGESIVIYPEDSKKGYLKELEGFFAGFAVQKSTAVSNDKSCIKGCLYILLRITLIFTYCSAIIKKWRLLYLLL